MLENVVVHLPIPGKMKAVCDCAPIPIGPLRVESGRKQRPCAPLGLLRVRLTDCALSLS